MLRYSARGKCLVKIIWAVDAFEPESRLRENAASVLQFILQKEARSIEPVFVLSPGQLNLTEEMVAWNMEHYRPAAEKAFRSALQSVEIPGLLPPKILVQNSISTLSAVYALADYALAENAEFILAGSRSTGRIRRLLLGSFAESLLTHSQVPVLIVGSDLRWRGSVENIVFPTEFGTHSEEMFRKVVRMAKGLSAKVILFHSVPHPVEPVLQSGVYLLGGAWVSVHSYVSRQTERRQRHAEAWSRWATHQGVECEVVIHTEGGSIADTVLALADSRANSMIAMEAQTGPIISALLGSVTRHVLRKAHCPVWVLRWPKAGQIQPERRAA